MAFPTIPTVAAGRVLTGLQADTSATRTFPSLTGLTKNSGDLLIAICIAWQSAQTNAAFSSWGGGFTEFLDRSTASTMALGFAYKWSTGSETGTFTVTQATVIQGHAAFILLSIPGAHASTPPEGGAYDVTTGVNMADPASFDPAGWGAEDTLWIAVCGDGEDSTTGSYTGIASAPTNYTNYVDTGISADVVGGVEGAVAFRQLNASSENVGTFTADTSNARHAAAVIAVRPLPVVTAVALGAWGAWTATSSAGVKHLASGLGAWGAWTATAAAGVKHAASGAAAWGALTATANATTSHTATAEGTWGVLNATASATVTHPAVASATWGAWDATALATTESPSQDVTATGLGAWGAWTASATANVRHTASASATWGEWTATATATQTRHAVAVGQWGAWRAVVAHYTPAAERILIVRAEDRLTYIPAEPRTLVVRLEQPAEPTETRTTNVRRERRTLEVR